MKRVIISGGGTGGHIFPAIAIANALKAKVEDIDILFIGAKGRLEMEKVPAAGYRIEGLTISGFQRKLTFKNLTFPFKLLCSLIKARSIISKFKPDLVIGVGGYASGPTLHIATSKGIPSLIQEQNSFPGITNRILGKKVRKICVAYEGMSAYFPKDKIVLTGNPIRNDVSNNIGKEEEARKYFGLIAGVKTLLVIGGSQGAGTINQAILKFVKRFYGQVDPGPTEKLTDSGKANIQILWQTGKYYFENIIAGFPEHLVEKTLSESKIENRKSKIENLVILPFIDRVDLAYAAADIIVSRAGAISISELCVVGKPVILVPSPNVAEDHQMKNARFLVDRHAALLVSDCDAVEKLGTTIINTFADIQLQSELRTNISSLAITNAADVIADVALSLIKTNEIAKLKSVYFLGIGGIGMSALARYFKMQGAVVSGYDKTPTSLTDQLISEGMQIHFQEDLKQIPPSPDLVIYTPAVPQENRELVYFKEHGIPMKKRAEVLGMISGQFKTIAVAGTHGKTSTSTMIAHILRTAGIDQLAFLGGISKNWGTNFLLDLKSDDIQEPHSNSFTISQSHNLTNFYCVVEADEYDRSFLQLSPHIAIITSADADHLDIYGNHDDLKKTFSEFTARISAGGSLILKAGTSIVPTFTNNYSVWDYSIKSAAAFFAQNIRLVEGHIHFDFVNPGDTITDLILGVPGQFNLENAIAALAVGYLLGINHDLLREAVLSYKGVQRRFDLRIQHPDLVYIDDYAHHPEELKACINAVIEMYPGKKITGIFQPHLYSRTRDFADEFARSLELLDELLLLDIYPAREEPIEGVTSQMLLDRVKIQNKKLVQKNNLITEIQRIKPEVLLTLGAGDIDQFVLPITEILNKVKK
ncbi:MAG: undecaprenyldiphospho-muramoylpentapeptide beta-N-acetylglucosaminyltransferase [Bacteroidota bacterium]